MTRRLLATVGLTLAGTYAVAALVAASAICLAVNSAADCLDFDELDGEWW